MRKVVPLALCALAVAGCGARKTAVAPMQSVVVSHGSPPRWLLTRARRAAAGLGDAHPARIELFASGRSYPIQVWGRFRCDLCSRPAGAAAPTGQVATFVYRGHTRVLSSFSLAPAAVVAAANATAPVVREWRAALRHGARVDPDGRFASPPLAILRARLARAARRYGFSVDLIAMRHPRELAPQIRIRSAHRAALAHAIGPIMDTIDPPHSNDRAYEGILIEAVDGRGVPYAIAWNALRGRVAGGQWASAPDLYPFAHG